MINLSFLTSFIIWLRAWSLCSLRPQMMAFTQSDKHSVVLAIPSGLAFQALSRASTLVLHLKETIQLWLNSQQGTSRSCIRELRTVRNWVESSPTWTTKALLTYKGARALPSKISARLNKSTVPSRTCLCTQSVPLWRCWQKAQPLNEQIWTQFTR